MTAWQIYGGVIGIVALIGFIFALLPTDEKPRKNTRGYSHS